MFTDNANPEGERCLIEPDLGKHLPLCHFVTMTYYSVTVCTVQYSNSVQLNCTYISPRSSINIHLINSILHFVNIACTILSMYVRVQV